MSWSYLQKGDVVDLIAPGYGVKPKDLQLCITYIESLGLVPRVPDDLLGDDLFSSNTDDAREAQLKDALTNTVSKAIWCIKGGYGTSKLIPNLNDLIKPDAEKLLIGFSDITALHIFVSQNWGWKSLHAPVLWQVAKQRISPSSIQCLEALIFGENEAQEYPLLALNNIATQPIIEAEITGGNLMLVQTSIGTNWQIDTRNKILFLEDVDERAYRVERTLTHLQQAGIFAHVKAIIFGDFECESIDGQEEFLAKVIDNFANNSPVPVYKILNIGHGKTNQPLPLSTPASIDNKNNIIHINNK